MNKDARSDNAFERDKPGTNARTEAEAAIEQLRQRGGIFVEAVRATRMPMALTDPNLPGNPIVFANAALLKLSGYRMEEILGQQPHFMNGAGTDPKDAAHFAEAIRSDQDDIIETVQYRQDGSRFVATVLISAFKDEQGRVLNHFMSWLDVTRRVDAEVEVADLKATQAALRASEAKYRGLFESIDEGFCTFDVIFDDTGKAVDYRFVEVNPAFERHTGLHDATGRRMRELAPKHEEHWFEIYGDIARTGEPRAIEAKGEALGDRWFEVNAFRLGEPHQERVAAIFRDVTARKRAEAALRQREERQAFLLELSDALRPLADAAAIQSTTTHLLGEHLGVDRTMYAEVEGEQGAETGTIRGQYVRASEVDGVAIARFPEHFTFADFGKQIMAGRYRGEPLVVADIDTAAGFEPFERDAWRAANVRSAIVIPLVKEGRLVAEFGVHCAKPRQWTDAEVALMGDVAERTWAAAERAQVETALRESERLRTAMLDVLPLGLALINSNGNAILTNSEWARFVPTSRIPSRDKDRGSRWRSWDTEGTLVEPKNYPGARALRGERVHPPLEFLFTDDDGHEIWTSVGAVPFHDADGNTVGAVCFIMNIDAAKRGQEALRDSEEQLRLIVESARDYAIFTTDLNKRITSWLPGAENVFGWAPQEVIGQPVDITFTPEDREQNEPNKEIEEARRTGTAPNVRWHVRKDGSRVFIDGHVVALRNEQGEVDGFLKIGQDTTEKHQAREHERMLHAELQHRVRNTLAVIRSIVRRTGNTASSVEEFEQNLDGRLNSFARTQAHVTRDPEGSISLELIVRDELLAHAADGKRSVVIDGPEVRLTSKQAETLGLAIHELTSNAIRHGALASEGNRVEVGWSLAGAGDGRALSFRWREQLADDELTPPERTGFGTELLERVMEYELDAETRIEYRRDGFSYRAEIPLPPEPLR